MEKKSKKDFCIAICLIVAFVAWTLLVRFVDVRDIGPGGSTVGFATLNGAVSDLVGVNMLLYSVTDWLGLVPIAVALGFAILGLVQWARRKSLLDVDSSILALGIFYIVVIAGYVFFEIVVVNYRPVIINGNLEASYPSSTTMVVLCVMTTAAMQLRARIKNVVLRRCVAIAIIIFIAFMVVGRLLSGVHWVTDIIGGALFASGLVLTYHSICGLLQK